MNKTELIKNTYEMRYYKTQFIMLAIISPILLLLIILSFFSPENGIIALPLSVLLLVYIPFVIHSALKIRSFLDEPERYEILNATATDAHFAFGMGKGRMYLDLEITTADGGTIHTESKGVYTRGFLGDAYYKNFVGNRFRVLYDRTTGTVLIINE